MAGKDRFLRLSQAKELHLYGCFYKLGVLFVGVSMIRVLLLRAGIPIQIMLVLGLTAYKHDLLRTAILSLEEVEPVWFCIFLQGCAA